MSGRSRKEASPSPIPEHVEIPSDEILVQVQTVKGESGVWYGTEPGSSVIGRATDELQAAINYLECLREIRADEQAEAEAQERATGDVE